MSSLRPFKQAMPELLPALPLVSEELDRSP